MSLLPPRLALDAADPLGSLGPKVVPACDKQPPSPKLIAHGILRNPDGKLSTCFPLPPRPHPQQENKPKPKARLDLEAFHAALQNHAKPKAEVFESGPIATAPAWWPLSKPAKPEFADYLDREIARRITEHNCGALVHASRP